MSTIHKQLLAVGVLVSLGLTACSGSGTSPESVTTSNLGSNVLQFAVGTANLQGVPGLNVATTYRQPKGAFHAGDSAVFVSSPSLSGPFAMPSTAGTPDSFFSTIESGPAPAELGGHTMGSTGQNSQTISTFGTSGGVIGLGIEPFNYNVNGHPVHTTPYTQPLYDQIPSDPNGFIPWGGPPAYATLASSPQRFIPLGLDIFAVAPSTGAYTLDVAVPANTGTFHATANANIGSTALLPSVSAPTPVLDGNGGGHVTFTLPAGVTEAFIQITDIGFPGTTPSAPGCNGAGAGALYYTLAVLHSGTQTLGDTLGPGGAPTLCTSAQNTAAASSLTAGDNFLVQVIGFDYPWFEASYPNSLGNPNPPISNASTGQADVTVSAATEFMQPSTGGGQIVRIPTQSIKTRLPR